MGKERDPRKQFSKWLARYGAIFWGFYLLVIAFLIYAQPSAAISCVYLALIVTANKALDTISYTDNSKTEKILLAGLERTKMELTLKAATEKAEAEEEEEEGGGNG